MTILCISIGSVVAIDSSIIENNTNLENVSENRLNIISNEGIDDETEVIGSDEVINVEDEVIGSNENVKISEENLNSSFNSSYVENFPECDNDVRFTNDTYKVYFADVETEGDNYFNISFSLNSNNLKTQSVMINSLTKNCKNDLEKANALFTYVRSSISYSYYYNTKYKASGTLTNKKGNCCDKSNLLVALCRASGIAARYCHSTSCNFNSGLNCGHVWAQVAVDGVWYVADTTSSSNTLGHINNWNINSVGTINQYASLPF